jgi:hypothetical protein
MKQIGLSQKIRDNCRLVPKTIGQLSQKLVDKGHFMGFQSQKLMDPTTSAQEGVGSHRPQGLS